MSARAPFTAALAWLLLACSSRSGTVNGAVDASRGTGGSTGDSSAVDTSATDATSADRSIVDASLGGADGAGGNRGAGGRGGVGGAESIATCAAPKLAGVDTSGAPSVLLSQTGLYADLPSQTC